MVNIKVVLKVACHRNIQDCCFVQANPVESSELRHARQMAFRRSSHLLHLPHSKPSLTNSSLARKALTTTIDKHARRSTLPRSQCGRSISVASCACPLNAIRVDAEPALPQALVKIGIKIVLPKPYPSTFSTV